MIIFLYGQDAYRMREKLKEIIERHKKVHKSGLNLKSFDCAENKAVFENLKDEIRQSSMFGGKKLAVVTNFFSDAGFKERFLKEEKIFSESEDIILLCEEGDVNKKDILFKFLEKTAKCQEFDLLKGQRLKNWAKKEFENQKIGIEPQALDKLLEYVGSDLWRMANEIRKLVSFKPKGLIKIEDIKSLIRSKIETDIFKTIDAISQKNKKLALNLLHKHLEKGDHPLYLLSMIAYQFRNLLIVKDFIERQKPYNLILKKSGLHPFVARKSYFQSQKFTPQELKKIYQKIFQVDLNIKLGKIEPEMALDMLIAEI